MPTHEIATESENAFEQTTSGTSVTGTHVIADAGKDKEATTLDSIAGASSTASASSGIPSAMTQQGLNPIADDDNGQTPMVDGVIETTSQVAP